MQKKQMVITGASKGIGQAIAESFKDKYQVITISRTSGDFVGDLRQKEFRNHILEKIDPFIFVNNAAVYPSDKDYMSAFELNAVAMIDFTTRLLRQMKEGYIFNISSVSAAVFPLLDMDNIIYSSSKSLVSHFSQLAQASNFTKVKVCTIEPGMVLTDFAQIKKRFQAPGADEYIKRMGIMPMDPAYRDISKCCGRRDHEAAAS